jgi:hypothetical protein
MADHPDDVVGQIPEVECAVASLGEAAVASEELAKERQQIQSTRGEDAQVSVHRQDRVVGLKASRNADRNRLLADP